MQIEKKTARDKGVKHQDYVRPILTEIPLPLTASAECYNRDCSNAAYGC